MEMPLLVPMALSRAQAGYRFERLEVPNATKLTTARGINDLGVIVGNSGLLGVIWDHGTVTTAPGFRIRMASRTARTTARRTAIPARRSLTAMDPEMPATTRTHRSNR